MLKNDKKQLLTLNINIMKTNKIKITFLDGSIKWLQATNKKLQATKNVVHYVAKKFDLNAIKKIESRRTGAYDKNYKYFELHYHYKFEYWSINRTRIEATNPKGHEDYTGYGSRTNGTKNRFYIGKSTGWMPIYLEILQNNSHGGGSLYLTKGRTFNRI